jgi:hypothetical protein
MRGAWIIAAALVVCAAAAVPARAGVYFTTGTTVREFARPDDPNAEELWPSPSQFRQFQQDLADYRAGAVDGPLHAHYLRRAAELEAKEARGALTLDDRINLGAYYIRLGEFQKAVGLLEAKAKESRHFLLRANLATAYELAGVPERALSYRQLALSSWPAMYPAWDTRQMTFYRRAEQFHLTLLQARQDEARQRPGDTRLRLDNLFPRVRFVGPGGEYEAGAIAPAQAAEIPNGATDLVMQLLLWLPFDDRLHWMLGELLNASGDVAGAAAIMRPVIEKPQDPKKWQSDAPPELREHYRILAAEAVAQEKIRQELLTRNDRYLNLKLLFALAPRGLGLGAGDLMQEASWVAMAQSLERPPPAESPSEPKAAAAAPPSSSWLPSWWRQAAVSFGAGAVIAWLLGHQIRQARLSRRG